MGKAVANMDYSLSAVPNSAGVPGSLSGIPVPGVSKVSGSQHLGSSLPFTASGCTIPSCTFVSGGGSLSATSAVLWDSAPTLRDNEQGSCSGTHTNNSSGATIPCSCTVLLSAGQSTVTSD